ISNWEQEQENIELQGKISLVHGAVHNSLNIVLMYRGSFNTPKNLKNGIVSFLGSNGAVAWDFKQDSQPNEMDCSLIDINGNGYTDCLVTDERGLKAIETISGEAVRHAHSADEKSIPELDMPVKLTDFNDDGVSELLSVYKQKYFLLISGNKKLRVENFNNCPHCKSTISFYNSSTKLKEWPYQNAFVMTPIPFSFQSTKDNIISLRGHVNGFILKIWEYRKFSKKLSANFKVSKRSIPVNNQSYYMNEISERIVLITFNETDTHIINASLTDVYQICNGPNYPNNCQPDHKGQQNSLLIADMDHDGSQELISYSSSYVNKDNDDGSKNWHLVSYLKVFRLENELPTFYGTK
ncbi:hypothetical protein NQ318_006741, partial [Aromia moschata]